MRPHLVSKSTIAILFLCVSFASAQESRQLRIVRPIDNRDVVRLQGTVHPRASSELDQGPVSPKLALQHMTLTFQPMAAQQAALKGLLAAQLDRSSPDYHKWLTPEEYGDRFGLNEIDANTVATWLRSQGFTVEEIARSRTWISFSGIAAQVEAAFHTSIHNYLVDGTLHYSPASEPSIPAAFAGVVTAIGGLHDFRPQPRSRARRINPRLTSSISGNHFLVPGDFGTIYNLPDYVQGSFQPGNDGSGQSIAIVGQTRIVGSPTALSPTSTRFVPSRICPRLTCRPFSPAPTPDSAPPLRSRKPTWILSGLAQSLLTPTSSSCTQPRRLELRCNTSSIAMSRRSSASATAGAKPA